MRDYEHMPNDNAVGPLEERYQELSVLRRPFLEEARLCAALTIPSLCPPENMSKGAKLPEPYQSYGAMGVKNLAEKMCRSLFPPGRAFFRLSLSQFELRRQVAAMSESMLQAQPVDPRQTQQFLDDMTRLARMEIEDKLAECEQAIMREFEVGGNRPTDSEAMKHLINDGSVLRYCPRDKDELPRIFDLAHHVVERDPSGKVLDMLTCEGVTAGSLDPDIREACGLDAERNGTGTKEYNLYTRIRRGDKHWHKEQEINGITVPDSYEEYPFDDCPYIALRWTKIDGESYGRSYVSDYRGTLRMLEDLSRALQEGGIAASRLIGLVNPNSQYGTRLRDISRAKNGDIIPGNAQDVSWLRVDKQNDMGWVLQVVQMLAREVSRAFLLNSSVQRDAERVTAAEFTAMIQELEGILGGTYAAFGPDYQRPILSGIMSRMREAETLPELPAEVEPTIITGVDAMGRTADLERLAQLGGFLQMFPQEVTSAYVRFEDLLRQGCVALGIQPNTILRSEDEVERMRQQQQQLALAQQAVGPAINAGAQIAAAEQSIPQENM